MTDYISREAAIKRFTFATLDCLGMEPTIMASDVVAALKSLPAADVREVKRGKWETKQRHEHYPSGDPYEADYCSVCGKRGSKEFLYCPNCGSDMRGENNG